MPKPPGRKDLPLSTRHQIVAFFKVRRRSNGSLPKGCISAAAKEYNCHRNTVTALWNLRDTNLQAAPRPGRPPRFTGDTISDLLESIPAQDRTSVRATAAAANLPSSTLQKYIGKRKPLRRASSHVKPAISDDHKTERLKFALSHVERPLGLQSRRFDPMYDVLHIDEKWFYLHRVESTYILTRRETVPYHSCANKRFIAKVVFLAAVARPRYEYSRCEGFDGKIGNWPIIRLRKAKRTTKNQTKGELIPEPLNVDTGVYRKLLIEKLLPAIQAKWPDRKRRTIYIQQDSATPHKVAEATIMESSLGKYGWDVKIRKQPAKSPDFNILDLGYFRAIQSLQHRTRAYSVNSLVTAVCDSFKVMKVETLEKCFMTLQAVMEQVMLVDGGNHYDMPRVRSLHFPNGDFPSSIKCSDAAYDRAFKVLNPNNLYLKLDCSSIKGTIIPSGGV